MSLDVSVMVTGGAGYIGSHAVQRLLRDGARVVCVDNMSRGCMGAIDRLAELGKDRFAFAEHDIGDRVSVARLLADHRVGVIMHFAALAMVGESVDEPLTYYRNNTAGVVELLEAADEARVERFVFSSTCATYGEPSDEHVPIPEHCPQAPINPYGASKLHVERMLSDFADAKAKRGEAFSYAALRYFNVAGADRTGVLGEDHDPETHLIPVVIQAALGKRDGVKIFGTDYPTPDGTCVRDYVHVEDLIDAHVEVMHALRANDRRFYNLGIGKGYSVREIIDAVQRVTGVDFAVGEGERRPGDPPRLFADPTKIQQELNWRASITDLDEIIGSAWNWFRAHPNGYEG
ncbi:MAG: UDP-glucose 4-epimerase GalE [Planctomycetota bacterium]